MVNYEKIEKCYYKLAILFLQPTILRKKTTKVVETRFFLLKIPNKKIIFVF